MHQFNNNDKPKKAPLHKRLFQWFHISKPTQMQEQRLIPYPPIRVSSPVAHLRPGSEPPSLPCANNNKVEQYRPVNMGDGPHWVAMPPKDDEHETFINNFHLVNKEPPRP